MIFIYLSHIHRRFCLSAVARIYFVISRNKKNKTDTHSIDAERSFIQKGDAFFLIWHIFSVHIKEDNDLVHVKGKRYLILVINNFGWAGEMTEEERTKQLKKKNRDSYESVANQCNWWGGQKQIRLELIQRRKTSLSKHFFICFSECRFFRRLCRSICNISRNKTFCFCLNRFECFFPLLLWHFCRFQQFSYSFKVSVHLLSLYTHKKNTVHRHTVRWYANKSFGCAYIYLQSQPSIVSFE